MSGFTAKYLTRVDTNDVRFTDVFYNEGYDYNATTGVFTCRILGIYWFSATLYGNLGAYCNILHYGAKKAFVGYPGDAFATGRVFEVIRLRHADRVHVGRCTTPGSLHFNGLNTFSGVLVKADR